jgi:hypothetical protein
MISHLRHPPLGFEEVAKRHFALCRKPQGTALLSFGKAYEELMTLLTSDDLVNHKLPG